MHMYNVHMYNVRNLPLLVLKARHLSGSAFCAGFSRLKVPEQALGGIPPGLGLVVKINLSEYSCILTSMGANTMMSHTFTRTYSQTHVPLVIL